MFPFLLPVRLGRTCGFAVTLVALLLAFSFYPGLARGAAGLPTLQGIVVRHASWVLPEPAGKLIAVGEPSADGGPLPVVEFRADGKIDPSFDASALGLLALDSILRLPNGKLLLAGFFADATGQRVHRLAKLNSDGTVDANFQPGKAFAAQPLLQSDGRILLLDLAPRAGGPPRPTLTRLHPDGRVDTSFHPGIDLAPGGTYALRLLPDGKLLVIGRDGASLGQPSLQRLESDGTLDRQFQAAGPVAAGYGVRVLALTSDGKLLVAEYADDGRDVCTLTRLEADGSLDPDFQADVLVDGRVDLLAEDRVGEAVLSGAFTEVNGIPEPGFARLKNDGHVDTAFDPLGTSETRIYDFVVDPYGTVTFAFPSGFTGSPNGPPSTLVETYSADGSAVTAFNVEPCPSCELVPAAGGEEFYVRVISPRTAPSNAP